MYFLDKIDLFKFVISDVFIHMNLSECNSMNCPIDGVVDT